MATATKSTRAASQKKGGANRKASRAKKAKPKIPDPTDRAANAAAAAAAAAKGTKAAGQAAGAVVSRAKRPLIIGGAAVAGVAGGLALRRHATAGRRRSPLSGPNLPMRDGRLDLGAMANGAQRLGELGQQLGDLAAVFGQADKKAKR